MNDIKPGKYRHFKGNEYEVLFVAKHSETQEDTRADCFESWKPMYRRTFKQWKNISKKEDEQQEFHECKLCEKYYDVEDED